MPDSYVGLGERVSNITRRQISGKIEIRLTQPLTGNTFFLIDDRFNQACKLQ